MSRVIRAALTTAALVGVLCGAAVASAAQTRYIGPQLGVMPDRNPHAPIPFGVTPFVHALTRVSCPQPQPDPACNMTYHGGDLVIGPHTTYVVYWVPSGYTMGATYQSLINRYLTDVAADSGRATNVYATDTQYDDSTNTFIQYSQTFGGSFVDTNAFPATPSGCPTTDGTLTVAVCLSQTQQSTELDNFIQTNSLPRGLNNLYFLVMPNNVETCNDAFTNCGNLLDLSPRYCAYHSWFNIGGHGLTIWANEPFINTAAGHCASGSISRPNGDVADVAINPLSHEHNEIITDPTGGGWFDVNLAGENGDKCNFNFGTAIASNVNGAYNQLINHNPYEIQLEWDNSITGCSANYGAVAPTADFTSSPASPKALDPVSFDGSDPAHSHSNNTGGYIISWDWTFGDGGTSTSPTPSHTYSLPGTYTVSLTVKDDVGLTDATSRTVTVVKRPTTTVYTGAVAEDFHDLTTLSAHLTDASTSAPLSGKTIDFTLGSQSCSDTTNGSGDASCSIVLTQIPGPYTVTASFGGTAVYDVSSASHAFTIQKEETTTTYVGPTVVLQGASGVTLSGLLLEDGNASAPIAARTLTLGIGVQTCTGVTDGSGVASCAVVFTGPLGSEPLLASFAGDAYYLPSSDTSKTATVFAFPSRGAFVLGDIRAAAAGSSTVTWWSDAWWSLNSLSGGTAPLSFKGFAGTVSTLPTTSPADSCGTTFRTGPGNSPPPTSGVPEYMGVLVSGSVTKSGNTINGSWAKIVVVHVAPGYSPSPGHPGTGTIVATFCP